MRDKVNWMTIKWLKIDNYETNGWTIIIGCVVDLQVQWSTVLPNQKESADTTSPSYKVMSGGKAGGGTRGRCSLPNPTKEEGCVCRHTRTPTHGGSRSHRTSRLSSKMVCRLPWTGRAHYQGEMQILSHQNCCRVYTCLCKHFIVCIAVTNDIEWGDNKWNLRQSSLEW